MRGFARVSVAIPPCKVAALDANMDAIASLWRKAHEDKSSLVVFPELSLSGYTARDLLVDPHLLQKCEQSLADLAKHTKNHRPMALVGAPIRGPHGVYNCAIAIQAGQILGVVPKSYLPTYGEFEERRWFRPGTEIAAGAMLSLAGQEVPFGTDLLFAATALPQLVVGVEICEDAWVQHPPHAWQVSAGATVCVNLSASNFVLGKADTRRTMAKNHSERGKCAYLYVAAGPGESSTDLAFDADAFVYENGEFLTQSQRFLREPQLVSVDVDLDAISHARQKAGSFGDAAAQHEKIFRRVSFAAASSPDLKRKIAAHPFLPAASEELAARCWETFEIQTHALRTRLEAIGNPPLVLGVSGGLDSTQAALVCAAALDMTGRPRSDLHCVTMPGLGTSTATRSNAEILAHSLGASFQEIPIDEATHRLLTQTEHPAVADTDSVPSLLQKLQQQPHLGDVSLENAQARYRTLILMTLANQVGGLVVGTGDLSEKALGWSTYNGDHLAMYDLNAGVPKTLIQFVIRWVAQERVRDWSAGRPEELRKVLEAILDTPISPELLPPDASGKIAQLTEITLGPYELHDFYLYHWILRGATPTRLLDLAQHAFDGRYTLPDLQKWLRVFLRRFFHNQFKRSATADAPKVCALGLSPRGDWRMPSDASPASWLLEVDEYQPEDAPASSQRA